MVNGNLAITVKLKIRSFLHIFTKWFSYFSVRHIYYCCYFLTLLFLALCFCTDIPVRAAQRLPVCPDSACMYNKLLCSWWWSLSVSSLQMLCTCCATVWSCCPSTSPARTWKTKCQSGSSSGTRGELLTMSQRTSSAICMITYTWLDMWLRSFTCRSEGQRLGRGFHYNNGTPRKLIWADSKSWTELSILLRLRFNRKVIMPARWKRRQTLLPNISSL